MRRSLIFAAIPVIMLLGNAFAAEQQLLRVHESSQPLDDRRLTETHDIDHPADFKPHFKDKADWERRAGALRTQVLVAEGLWPMPERTPLNPVVHGKIDRDGYTIEKVFFTSLPGHYVSGNLYRPKNKSRKLPVVLCPHGHWADGRQMWNSDKEAESLLHSEAEQTIAGARSPLQARCAMLARMGCIVFHYDMVGYADSQGIEHRKGFTDVESVLRLQSQMGLQTWNSIRALDFVLGLPDVDPARVAVTGASGGGTQTFILGAVDPRVAVAFPAVMVGMNMQGGCVCENAPLLRVGTNNVELAALFAPKPLGMSAANDWTIDLETRGLPELKSIYALYGHPDLVTAKHFSFPHNYNQVSREFMYAWFNKHLKLGQKEPVTEKPFVPVPVEQLSVYDAEHPRPADSTDAAGVRKYMTESSDRQLADLAKSPDEYRKTVGAALRAMLVDAMPGRDDVLAGRMSGPMRAGAVVYEKGFLTRRGSDERVPTAVLFPPDWNGTVVVWAHPQGKSTLIGEGGKPTPLAQKLLDAKAGVISSDLFLTGEFATDGRPAAVGPSNPTYAPSSNPPYAAFTLGYNRSLVANRVHDLLSVIALARGWEGAKSVRLVGFGEAGPWALLARAAAGDAIDRAAIDLNGFDFDGVKEANDPMLLPGALKYGGIYGVVPLCTSGETLLTHAKRGGKWELAAGTKGVTMHEEAGEAGQLVEWVAK